MHFCVVRDDVAEVATLTRSSFSNMTELLRALRLVLHFAKIPPEMDLLNFCEDSAPLVIPNSGLPLPFKLCIYDYCFEQYVLFLTLDQLLPERRHYRLKVERNAPALPDTQIPSDEELRRTNTNMMAANGGDAMMSSTGNRPEVVTGTSPRAAAPPHTHAVPCPGGQESEALRPRCASS